MKRRIHALFAAVPVAALLAVPAASATAGGAGAILEFDTMTPVVEPLTGAAQPIRGIPGGGLPWQVGSARGELGSDGTLEVSVEGLVLADRAPVPEATRGTNPIPAFRGMVSCTTVSDGTTQTVNVSTDPAPATPTGDAKIEAALELPDPCIAPIVLVTSPTGAWFAITGS